MRAPQSLLPALLGGCLGGALFALVGGTGGLWVQLRALRMRVDGHDDELEQANRRISRREGQAGRAAQRETTDKLNDEARAILEAARKEPRKRNGAPPPGSPDEKLLAWCNSMFAGAGDGGDEA